MAQWQAAWPPASTGRWHPQPLRPAPDAPPGEPILDVVQEALRHQRVLVQVDKMWRLGRIQGVTSPAGSRSPALAACLAPLSLGARSPPAPSLTWQGTQCPPGLAGRTGDVKEKALEGEPWTGTQHLGGNGRVPCRGSGASGGARAQPSALEGSGGSWSYDGPSDTQGEEGPSTGPAPPSPEILDTLERGLQ